MDTRFVELPFSVGANGTLTVDHPDNANLLTPGYWMLFAIDDNGVPSVAKTIKVKIGGQTMVAAAQGYATLSGDASETASGSFKLMADPDGNRGAVLFNDPVDLSHDISFSFDVKLGYCACGDGVTFLLHTNPHGEGAPAQVIEAGGLRVRIGAHGDGGHDHDGEHDHGGHDHGGGATTTRPDGHETDGHGHGGDGHPTTMTPVAADQGGAARTRRGRLAPDPGLLGRERAEPLLHDRRRLRRRAVRRACSTPSSTARPPRPSASSAPGWPRAGLPRSAADRRRGRAVSPP